MTPDLVKRFTATPYETTLALNNTVVQVSTNHPLVLDRLGSESRSSEKKIHAEPAARWRVVVEENVDLPISDSAVRSFSHDGLAFIRIGRGGFLASDRRAHTGISFVAQELVENERLFIDYYLPALLLMLQEMELPG